jgi:hypothetical protein
VCVISFIRPCCGSEGFHALLGKKSIAHEKPGPKAGLAGKLRELFLLAALGGIDSGFQFGAHGELDGLGGGDLQFLTGLRIPANAGSAFSDGESAKTDQIDTIARRQSFGDDFQEAVQGVTGSDFGDVAFGGQSFNQLGFVHGVFPCVSKWVWRRNYLLSSPMLLAIATKKIRFYPDFGIEGKKTMPVCHRRGRSAPHASAYHGHV